MGPTRRSLSSSKALATIKSADESQHAVAHFPAPQEGVDRRQPIEDSVLSDKELEQGQSLDDVGQAGKRLVFVELGPGIEPVATLADGQQRAASTALVDRLTADMQELAGALGRERN